MRPGTMGRCCLAGDRLHAAVAAETRSALRAGRALPDRRRSGSIRGRAIDLDETGIASIVSRGRRRRLTTDGELFDQTALAAAHPTIQLPAIARLTNLENGREVTVRINDRGSGDPHRLVEVTRRTATLLGMPPGGVARVRLRVLPNESQAAAEAVPGAPSLALAAAPRGAVEVAELAPLPGVRQGNGRRLVGRPSRRPSMTPTAAAPPMRLPETVTQTDPAPWTADGASGYVRRAISTRPSNAPDGRLQARMIRSVFEGRYTPTLPRRGRSAARRRRGGCGVGPGAGAGHTGRTNRGGLGGYVEMLTRRLGLLAIRRCAGRRTGLGDSTSKPHPADKAQGKDAAAPPAVRPTPRWARSIPPPGGPISRTSTPAPRCWKSRPTTKCRRRR